MIPEPLVLVDEWRDHGDIMLAPADPDPLRTARTARYLVSYERGPVYRARKLDRPMGDGWPRADARAIEGGPWATIEAPHPYATGRLELALRDMGRSLVLVADYCGGPDEATRALNRLPPAFVESARERLRAEEAGQRRAFSPLGTGDSRPLGPLEVAPFRLDQRRARPGPEKAFRRTLLGDGTADDRAAGRALIAPAHQTDERYPRGWHPEDEER